MRITIVGAGVVGMTTALALEERGHHVEIVANAPPLASVSAVAGALWFPYRAGPPQRVAAWAAHTQRWLAALAADPATGVDRVVGWEITADAATEPTPWWAAGLDVERATAPVTDAPVGWRYEAARVEPAVFLPWLRSQLRARVVHRTVTDLAAEPGELVINCAGLGARDLAGDPAMVGLLGQVVICEPAGVDLRTAITDDRDPHALFYLIPRRSELVLGGCAIPWPAERPAVVDHVLTRRILDHAAALGLPVGEVRDVRVGLRPYRPEVRLERDPADPRVFHHYGHGGSGYTLARGSADELAALVT